MALKPDITIMPLVARVLLLLSLFISVKVKASAGALPINVAKPNCAETCGDVIIPFPFGIGPGCFLDEWYEVVCRQENNATTVTRLNKIGLDVLGISLPILESYSTGASIDGWISVRFPILYSSPDCLAGAGDLPTLPPSLAGSNFVFSQDSNIFTVVGCGELAFMNTVDSGTVGCKPECKGLNNITGLSNCSGSDCYCHNAIPLNLQEFDITFQKVAGAASSGVGCAYAFLVDKLWFNTSVTNLPSFTKNMEYKPVTLGWGITDNTSLRNSLVKGEYQGPPTYSCWDYGFDQFSYDRLPYMQCYCLLGYEGNPYLGQGCQDIDECVIPEMNHCPGKCVNTRGSYKCVDNRVLAVKVIGGCFGAVFVLLSVRWLCRTVRRRKRMKLKQKFFKQNGGRLLQQQLASPEGNVEKSKLFSSKELEKATDNFNENRILGRGGQGTVYKGMLTDGRIIAIKKSKALEKGNVEQFINEVFILSQINHRNVVKLLGCCLETEVPLLVYEFIPNGTLYQYLHDPNEEFPVLWDVRLRIASEVAGAVFYLHSAASIPIYHRDIKTTNILLDEKYRAKIADFGTSRSVALDQTHVTTLVQGTFGYLDPEYFQSSQFTDKSDVYSFGVVLVELLTGEKPIRSLKAEEERSLVTYFILSMEEDRLFDILDAQVMDPGNVEDINAVAHIAKRCLNMKGRNRPTMKEVAMELEAIRRQSHNPADVPAFSQRYEKFEINGIEARYLAFGSEGSEAGDTMSSIVDVNSILSSGTW